jgi:hypothetical protein
MGFLSRKLSYWKKSSAFISTKFYEPYFGGFGGKLYSVQNNKVRENSEDIVFIIFW